MRAVAEVAEAAAVGVPAPGGGPERLVLFLVVQQSGESGGGGADGPQEQRLKAECQAAIRNNLNPLFKVDRVVLRASLPRTASNKVMRRVLRDELQQPAKARL